MAEAQLVLESAPQQEARRLLEAAARHTDKLVRHKKRLVPRQAAELLGLQVDPARVKQNVAALSFLSEMFAELAAYAAQGQASAVLEAAQRRGDILRKQLIAKKDLLPSGEFTEALGITRQALNKAVKAGRIFALESGGDNYYPAFLADPRLERRRAERVTKTLGDLSSWEKWLFFTSPKASLGRRTPIEAMQQGDYERVLRAAAAQAER